MKTLAFLFAALLGVNALAQTAITSPEQAFGFKPGTDRKLADWVQLTSYFKTLSTQSKRVLYEEVGKTTEGRPFVAVTISAPDTLAHLDDYKRLQAALADPRVTTPEQAKELVARGKTVLVVTCNIHSTEIASAQSSAEFAYRLASEDSPEVRAILQNVIIVLVPSLNPDGEQLVVDWYKKYLGTPYEGSNPVVLYHHYVGHDDNRDWSSFTQIETRLAVQKVINPWHPQILYDIHQMQSNGPRIYLPPWVDPIDPNVDPLLVQSMNALGTQTAFDIARTGKQGVLIHGVYDFWSPLRDYIALHNGLRVLTESASVNIASPINIPFSRLGKGIGFDAKLATWNFPDPWKGGRWTLGDIVAYQQDAFFSIARNAAINREHYLSDYYTLGQHALHPKDAPFAYVIPAEQTESAAAARLVNILITGANEVQQARASFSADGKQYAAGSYIVKLAQPYGAFAKSLLEIQDYPNIPEYPGGPLQRPYDVTAQTLPLLFGVKAVPVKKAFQVETENVSHAEPPTGSFTAQRSAPGYLIRDDSNSSLYALFALLKRGLRVYRVPGPGQEPDSLYVPQQNGLESALEDAAKHLPITILPAQAAPQGAALQVSLPRIALYQSWTAAIDEGWTRWIFDQNGIPYTSVVDADIRKGDLNRRFDVVILPDNSPSAITSGRLGREDGDAPQPPPEFRGGLGESGLASLRAFAEGGGTIVALNRASQVYTAKDSPVSNALESVAAKDFYIPGSILEVSLDTSSPLALGSKPTLPIFFQQGPAFRLSGNARSAANYTSSKPLLSGWILGGQYLQGTSALADEPVGKGHVILFGFQPQYRAQAEGTYRLFYNALLYGTSVPATLAAEHGPAHVTKRKGERP
ncbi:M14 family metallopeptidase [Terriglobus aquaticus]|uniref:M14 metallopeptidase family protein n=1 Tax=Terriglobus aquaticus TaxID=940139 RepID=A0ABW9KG90_9BACT|nr:M14 metallopeptidase family protein [Terriglobus aquaticus]